jgi:hypothetical protein
MGGVKRSGAGFNQNDLFEKNFKRAIDLQSAHRQNAHHFDAVHG